MSTENVVVNNHLEVGETVPHIALQTLGNGVSHLAESYTSDLPGNGSLSTRSRDSSSVQKW